MLKVTRMELVFWDFLCRYLNSFDENSDRIRKYYRTVAFTKSCRHPQDRHPYVPIWVRTILGGDLPPA